MTFPRTRKRGIQLLRARVPHAAALLMLAFAVPASAMQSDGWWPAVRRLFLPDVLTMTYDIRDRISHYPPRESATANQAPGGADRATARREADLARLDRIFLDALAISEGDMPACLLLCAIATLPYRVFPAVIPVLGISIIVPVSTESQEEFLSRLERLPAFLLPETPPEGDRDKLPHFFGAAYLESRVKAPPFVHRIAVVVEAFEGVFKLDGSEDERDVRFSDLGTAYADSLLTGVALLPSRIFTPAKRRN